MAIDTSIYNRLLQPAKSVADYDNEFLGAQQNRLAVMTGMQKADEYSRSVKDAAALRGVVSGFGADTGANQLSLLRAGRLSEANAYGKSVADAGETAAKTNDLAAKTVKTNIEATNLASQQHKDAIGLVNDPQTAAAWLQSMYSDPRLKDIVSASGTTVDQAIARIPKDAAGLQHWKMQASLGADKLIQQTMPDANARLNSDTSIKTNALNNATTQRGQNMTSATAAAGQAQAARQFNTTQENSKGQVVQTDNGPVLINTRTGAGTQVLGPDGQPLAGVTKPLNDSQSKALLFGSRMQASQDGLAKLAKEGTTTSVPMSRAPLIGGLINAASGNNNQMLDQYKRDFMTAVLRRESGASISDGEYDNADKQYFPQQGDGPGVIAQKARNRDLAINGILIEVPEKQRKSLTSPASKPATPKPVDVHAAADAILKGK